MENVPENNGFDDLSNCESSISSFTGFQDTLLDGESTNLSTFADFNDDLSDVESLSSTNSSFDGFDDICVKTECTTNELTGKSFLMVYHIHICIPIYTIYKFTIYTHNTIETCIF